MIENLFEIKISKSKFNGDLDSLKKSLMPKIKELMSHEECNNFYTMKNGGLCSYPVDNIKSWEELTPLINFIEKDLNTYWKSLNIKDSIQPSISSAWVSYYPPGAYFDYHNHNHVPVAIVFYLQKNKDAGNLILKNDYKFWKDFEERANTVFVESDEHIIDVEEGDIVMFPAFLSHKTEPNNSDQDRIIIGLDTGWLTL